MKHAIELQDWLQKKFFFKVDVALADGMIAQTGSDQTHFTFWQYQNVDLLALAVAAL